MQLVGTGWGLPIGPLCLEAPNPRLLAETVTRPGDTVAGWCRIGEGGVVQPREGAMGGGRSGRGQWLPSAYYRPGSLGLALLLPNLNVTLAASL